MSRAWTGFGVSVLPDSGDLLVALIVVCAFVSVPDADVSVLLKFDSGVVGKTADFAFAWDTDRWGVGGQCELKIDCDSVERGGEVWGNRGCCGLDTKSKCVGAGLSSPYVEVASI